MTSFIAAVFYGAIIYSAESGKFIVNSSYPKGYYSVPTIDGTSTEPSRYISMLSGIYSVYVTLAGGKILLIKYYWFRLRICYDNQLGLVI